ncbi:hypothetical protein LguiB_021344 [Lonicera macranthoides]
MDEIVKMIGLKNNCTFCGVFRSQGLDLDDIARLSRCTSITTSEDGPIPRCKPFNYTNEKEIVMYAYFNAYHGFAQEFIKDLERLRPRVILDIIKLGEDFRIATSKKMPKQGTCERCGYISSQKWCKACVLLEGLNRGLPKLGIGRSRGPNSEWNKDLKQTGKKNLQSQECGTLDF